MHVLGALAAGIRGAEDGLAFIMNRGTSTRATLYSDYQGTVLVNPSTGLVLDENGGLTVYVNVSVDIDVQDSDGESVRTWTEMVSSPLVEYTGQSFTGRDYDGSSAGANRPTTLQTILNAWKTSAGALDFNVLFNGASTTIQAALGSIAGLFINVKASTYGAVGDGVTDDTTPIQNALTDATTPHSIVFFPYGTYRITAKLTVPVGVSLWGVGAEGSKLTIDHATADTLEYGTGTSVSFQEIRGIAIGAAQTNTGTMIAMTNGNSRKLRVANCVMNSGLLNTGKPVYILGDNHSFVLDGSSIAVAGAAVNGIDAQNLSSVAIINGAGLTVSVNAYTASLVYAANLLVGDAAFVCATTSAGVGSCQFIRIDNQTTIYARINNSVFVAITSGPIAMKADDINVSGAYFVESGNIFQGFTTVYSGLVSGANRPYVQLGSRESRHLSVSDTNTATITIAAGDNGTISLTRTAAGAQTINADVVGPEGSYLTLYIYQATGGALGNVTLSGNFWPGIATFNPASGKLQSYTFRAGFANGSGAWIPVAPIYQIP